MKARLFIGTVAALVLAAALSAFGARDAHAWGLYGAYSGAQAYCDPTGGVQITANVGRYAGFSAQTIGFTHKLVNIDTGAETLLKFTTGDWWTLRHNQPFNGIPYAPLQYTTAKWNSVSPGRYRLYTSYAWSDGYWRTTGWIPASSYTHPWGGSQATYCLTRNPTLSDYGY